LLCIDLSASMLLSDIEVTLLEFKEYISLTMSTFNVPSKFGDSLSGKINW